MGCSTAGEISNKGVFNDSLIITACFFNKTKLATTESQISSMADSYQCGQNLGQKLISHNAKTVFMLGRGIDINGSSLIEGTRKILGPHTILTGGLAGDAGNFKTTYTLLNGQIHTDRVIALALSGESLEVGFGSQGGWEAFGPVRVVTRSIQNVLYELDGQPALQLYKKYLGDKAKDLPASGLLYPFQLLNESNDAVGLVRTILAVDE